MDSESGDVRYGDEESSVDVECSSREESLSDEGRRLVNVCK